MSGQVRYSISQICDNLELSPRTVRYYEELGLLPGVRRRTGGRRVYGPDEMERLRFIQRLKHLGLTLEEISDLNTVYAIRGSTRALMERLRDLLGQRLADVDAKIRELRTLRTEMSRYLERVERRINDLRAREEDGINANGQS
jgi:DNA-binding transcriptional MerR regulator